MQSLGLLLQVAFALAAVLGVIWISAKLARRTGLAGTHSAALRILGRQMLSRDSSVAVMMVGERAFVIGVTTHQVTLLSEVDPEEVLTPQPQTVTRLPASPGDIAPVTRVLERLRARTVRHE